MIDRNCSSTWFAASVTSPSPAPKNRKLVKLACRITERIRMSPFTWAMRRSRAGSNTRAQSRHCSPAKAERQSQRPNISPDHSAISVAAATPATPQPKPSTKVRSSTTFTPFISSCSASTPRARSMAISQPVSA